MLCLEAERDALFIRKREELWIWGKGKWEGWEEKEEGEDVLYDKVITRKSKERKRKKEKREGDRKGRRRGKGKNCHYIGWQLPKEVNVSACGEEATK